MVSKSAAITAEYLTQSRSCAEMYIWKLVAKLPHDDVIKWKHFPRYWPFVRGIRRSPVTSPHKGKWRGALVFSLICPRINGWVNNGEAGDLRRYRTHYDVMVMNQLLAGIGSDNGLVPNWRQSIHYLMQWRPDLLTHICVTRPRWFNQSNPFQWHQGNHYFEISAEFCIVSVSVLTLLMLETEYSGFGCQYYACCCSGS